MHNVILKSMKWNQVRFNLIIMRIEIKKLRNEETKKRRNEETKRKPKKIATFDCVFVCLESRFWISN